MCLIYKTSQDFHDNSVHMYILRLRNYPVELFVNDNNNNNNNNKNNNNNNDNDLFMTGVSFPKHCFKKTAHEVSFSQVSKIDPQRCVISRHRINH